MMSRYPRWFTLGHVEAQQCDLSSTMLNAAKSKSSMSTFFSGSKIVGYNYLQKTLKWITTDFFDYHFL